MPSPAGLLNDCVHCGKCLDHCPVFAVDQREELSPKAKQALGRALDAGGFDLAPAAVKELAALCVGCGKCLDVCPRGLGAPDLVARLREANPDFLQTLWRAWIERGGLLWPLISRSARLLPTGGLSPDKRLMAQGLAALESTSRLAPWLKLHVVKKAALPRKVALFPGCTASRVRTFWTKRAGLLVTELGHTQIKTPDFACCGKTLGLAGLPEAQHKAMRRNLEMWRKAGRPSLVVFCATCLAALAAYADAPELAFESDVERSDFRASILPLAALIKETSHEVEMLDGAPDLVGFHEPCHGRGVAADLDWLARTLGPKLDRINRDRCCGMGGVMQLVAPELSRQVAALAWERLDGPAQVLTACSGCSMQLNLTAPEGVSVGHWLEILA